MTEHKELLDGYAQAIRQDLKDGWQSFTPDCVDRLLQSLEQALGKVERAKWQPIETAPKDGTAILAWSSEYRTRETYWRLYGEGSPAHVREPGGGAFEWEEPINNWASSWKPTHWKPLDTPQALKELEE